MNTDGKQAAPDPNDHGRLLIEDGFIRYSSNCYGTWEIPISDVRTIGEYTNEDGPGIDDYFLVFLAASHSEWREASFYTNDRDKFLASAAQYFPDIAPLGLAGSTTFNSRVLWPPRHHGKELFKFTKLPRQAGVVGWFKSFVTFGEIEQRIAADLD
jgi:hypothetical protein